MIHERAIVHPAASVADDVEIGAYSVIGADVEIGSGSTLGPHVVIKGPTRIGCHNRIYPFCSLGEDPQDKKYAGERTRLHIGDGNTIRESCTINRGTAQDAALTRIGDDNWIMAYVHIAHDCQIGDHTVLANNATLAGHVQLADYVILGGFSKIHQYCRLGAHCFSAMDTGISRDVPPYVTVAGHLAEPKGVNSEGLRRRGFSAAQIRNIRQAYRTLYRSGLKLSEAIRELALAAAEQPEIGPLVEFLRSTERSIVR